MTAFIALWHLSPVTFSAAYFLQSSNNNSYSLSKQFIPNIAHYIYLLRDPSSELEFQFSEYLSVYAAWHYWQPNAIYLHTDIPDETIQRARDGQSGKWSRLLLSIPGLQVVRASVPTHADSGVEIKLVEHKSDFVRVQAIKKFGGIYIDFDAHPLRDIKSLRESGFNAIAGRQADRNINSGIFMSKKSSQMINLWAKGIHQLYDGGWTTHSNDVITRVGEKLVSEPGEMLIMDQDAFGPVLRVVGKALSGMVA